jgi:hypothetical protein
MELLYSDSKLTPVHEPALRSQIETSYCGMAHFAGTGPEGATCRQCAHWSSESGHYKRDDGVLKPRRCRRFASLNGGSAGDGVPHFALACRHYVANPRPPTPEARRRNVEGEDVSAAS